MSIRRKSTAHDLATLRLHPDGSRVQQSSINARRRTARSTVIDPRGNWIATDAGGKFSIKTRRNVSVHTDDVEREFFDFSSDEDARKQRKGKQRARDSQARDVDASPEPEPEQLGTRARQRLSFTHDLSFLDLPSVSVSSLKQDTEHSSITVAQESPICFPDPASDLLKSIHHFASCYYHERGQLLDSSRNYRGMKKQRYKESQKNIHVLAADTREDQITNSENKHTEAEDEISEEDEDGSEIIGIEDSGKEGRKPEADAYSKDMYKAFDGSALMAIGIVLQEYVAHTLTSKSRTSEESRSSKRRRTGKNNSDSFC